jgi:hypothetical protein
MPARVFVDRGGILRFIVALTDHSLRPEPEDTLAALRLTPNGVKAAADVEDDFSLCRGSRGIGVRWFGRGALLDVANKGWRFPLSLT